MRLPLAAIVLLTGCAHDPSATFTVITPDPTHEARNWPQEHRAELERYSDQAYVRWMTCTPRLRPRGQRRFTWERREDDPGATKSQGTVLGTRILLPLSYWLVLPSADRYSWIAHEMGHTWGIADLDTGADPALMSKTHGAPDVTPRDCFELCRLGWC